MKNSSVEVNTPKRDYASQAWIAKNVATSAESALFREEVEECLIESFGVADVAAVGCALEDHEFALTDGCVGPFAGSLEWKPRRS